MTMMQWLLLPDITEDGEPEVREGREAEAEDGGDGTATDSETETESETESTTEAVSEAASQPEGLCPGPDSTVDSTDSRFALTDEDSTAATAGSSAENIAAAAARRERKIDEFIDELERQELEAARDKRLAAKAAEAKRTAEGGEVAAAAAEAEAAESSQRILGPNPVSIYYPASSSSSSSGGILATNSSQQILATNPRTESSLLPRWMLDRKRASGPLRHLLWNHHGRPSAIVSLEMQFPFRVRYCCVAWGTFSDFHGSNHWDPVNLTLSINQFRYLGSAAEWKHGALTLGRRCDEVFLCLSCTCLAKWHPVTAFYVYPDHPVLKELLNILPTA